MTLEGKVVLVTGSSRGIGKEIALTLAQNGAKVVVNYLSHTEGAEEVANLIRKKSGEAMVAQADVTDAGQAKRLIETAITAFGKLDILVNNVGGFLYKRLNEVEIDEWHWIMNSNLHSAFYCSKFALEPMRKQKWGRIINIAAVGAEHVRAAPNNTPYRIAKTGVLILTKSLAVIEASNGITVNAIAPGKIDKGDMPEHIRLEEVKGVPMGRLGLAKEVAQAVLFFSSEEASYITGSYLILSGGWLL